MTLRRLKKGEQIEGKKREKLGKELKELYDQNVPIRALAKAINRSYGFVHQLLSETGVTFRERGSGHEVKNSATLIDQAKKLYEAGLSARAVGAKLGRSETWVRDKLPKVGVKFRSRGGNRRKPASDQRGDRTAI